LPKVISEMVGDALLGAAANRQVCPTISEMTVGNQSNPTGPFNLAVPGTYAYVAPGASPLLRLFLFSHGG
jgi:hypothetical protein